jgi:alpha-tubulin suppressor-like RCC1 family protein
VLKTDGLVWAWGENGKGQLGIGTTTDAHTPYTTQISNVLAIAAGGSHSLALKNDGSVWAWGDPRHLQLGNGTLLSPSLTPIRVPTGLPATPQTFLSDAKAIAAGRDHSLALTNSNEVWGWGSDKFAESSGVGGGLGAVAPDGTAVLFPQSLQGITGKVIAISAGINHSLAFTDGGRVWAWGHNDQGQLGDSAFADPFAVLPVKSLKTAKAIAAGGGHSIALAVSSPKVDHATSSFGNVQVNNSATLTVTVANDGAAPANINSFVSSNPSEFAVTSNCTTPVKLAVAAACVIEVTFRSGSAGNRTATLFINNDSPGGNLQVTLNGNGTP